MSPPPSPQRKAKRPVRGATLNAESRRFALPEREADDDWLDVRTDVDGEAPPLRTTVTVESPRTIINRNASPDIGFDRSINPYRGCDQDRNGCAMSGRGGIRTSTASLDPRQPLSSPIAHRVKSCRDVAIAEVIKQRGTTLD